MRIWLMWFLVLTAAPSHADQRWIWGVRLSEIAVDTQRIGQCFVRLPPDVDIPSYLALCKSTYLTFDCGAELPGSTRMNSLEKFESAKLAHALERRVALLVTEDQTISGYCNVRQIRVLAN